jgi:hypothetical protein
MFKIGNVWKVFSDKEKKIVDLGEDENAAKEAEKEHAKPANVAGILQRTSTTSETVASGSKISAGDSSGDAGNAGTANAGTVGSGQNAGKPGAAKPVTTVGVLQTVASEPKKYKLSPKLAAKIREGFAGAVASASVTVPEFLMRVFGYTAEDLDEDDSDVELLKCAWEAQLEVWTDGGDLPPWVLIAVAQTNLMLKMVLNAKRTKTAEQIAEERERRELEANGK